jgi:hypothetical protein
MITLVCHLLRDIIWKMDLGPAPAMLFASRPTPLSKVLASWFYSPVGRMGAVETDWRHPSSYVSYIHQWAYRCFVVLEAKKLL